MRNIKKYFFQYKIILIWLIILTFIGAAGIWIGEFFNNQIVQSLFDNVATMPFEIFITVFIIDRILKKRSLENDVRKEYKNYFDIAQGDYDFLINFIRHQIVIFFINEEMYHPDEYFKNKYQEIMKNIDNYYNENLLNEVRTINVVDQNTLSHTGKINAGYIYRAVLLDQQIKPKIDEHLSLFIKIMPIDIFNNLVTIKKQIGNIGYNFAPKNIIPVIVNQNVGNPKESIKAWKESFHQIDLSLKNLEQIRDNRYTST